MTVELLAVDYPLGLGWGTPAGGKRGGEMAWWRGQGCQVKVRSQPQDPKSSTIQNDDEAHLPTFTSAKYDIEQLLMGSSGGVMVPWSGAVA